MAASKLSFSDKIKKSIKNTKNQIDFKTVSIAKEFFLLVIDKTPVGELGIDPYRGRLVNNWNPGVGTLEFTQQQRPGPNKQGAIRRVNAMIQRGIFNKDTFVSLCNSTYYGWMAEYGGWHPPKWSEIPPYGMVRNSLIEISSKYK